MKNFVSYVRHEEHSCGEEKINELVFFSLFFQLYVFAAVAGGGGGGAGRG